MAEDRSIEIPVVLIVEKDGLTENIDIYPTLCELAGVPTPSILEGTSFAPLLHAPERAGRRRPSASIQDADDIMGYAMGTDRYRYTK